MNVRCILNWKKSRRTLDEPSQGLFTETFFDDMIVSQTKTPLVQKLSIAIEVEFDDDADPFDFVYELEELMKKDVSIPDFEMNIQVVK